MSKEKKEVKVYNFDEKKEEWHSKLGKNLPVWPSPILKPWDLRWSASFPAP